MEVSLTQFCKTNLFDKKNLFTFVEIDSDNLICAACTYISLSAIVRLLIIITCR